MGVIVTFDFTAWSALFPQFVTTTPTYTALTSTQVTTLILPLASQYCRNDGGGPVCDPTNQTALLNLMVAHVAQLLFGSSTQPLSALVGRIDSASEGSVSVHAEMPSTPAAAWFNQTVYGSAWWAMMSPYRTARYIPHPYPRNRGVGFGFR